MPFDISGEDRIEVVGESFYRAALREVASGAPDGQGESGPRHRATLVPEPSNQYDSNAVKIVVAGQQVGHLSREFASLAAAPLAELTRIHGPVEANAEFANFDSEHGLGVVLRLDLAKLDVVAAGGDGELEGSAPSSDIPQGSAVQPEVDEDEMADRRGVVERAVERWKTELIDLTARNRLLYMRDLRAGTLSLDRAGRDVVMQLVAGKRLLLSKIVPRSLPPDNPQAKLSPFEDAVRRMRTIARTARSYEEERGVRTLFLACGVATWKTDRASRPPAAPVLLVPIDIHARGASQQDFELSIAGDLEVNPTLLHLLRVEFNLKIDEQELFSHAEMDGVIDTPEELRLAFNWLSGKCASVSGWAIAERFVLGNFWYAKLPMVRDLEGSIDALASHDVAATLAGHEAARRAVVARRQDEPEGRPAHVDALLPEREFNVLDSDSSQSLAISRALDGENLVLKGPPGTGKSQTIANLISNAIGNGKRVLFVAEKRAAIEAVTKRLNKVGLGDLVLDLHRGAESRKWLAGQLGVSLEATRLAGRLDGGTEDGQFLRAREALSAHTEMLHRRHCPWDVSVFDAQMEVLDRGEPVVGARLRGKDLEVLSVAQLGELAEALRDLTSLDGLSLRAKGSSWAGAGVQTSADVEAARTLVDDLASLFAGLTEDFATAARSSRFRDPETFEAAHRCIAVWESLEACAHTFKSSILLADIDGLAEALHPMQGSGVSRFLAKVRSSDYREALARLDEHLQDGLEAAPGDIYAELLRAQELQPLWKQVRQGEVEPRVPEDLDKLAAAVEDATAKLSQLGAVLNRDLESGSFVELKSEVFALQADYATLGILPAIGIARDKFTQAALGSLLDELEETQGNLLATAEEELYRVWWRSLTDHLAMLPENTAALAGFRGERHDQTVATFREGDHRHIDRSAQRVLRIAAEGAIRAQDRYSEEAQLVRAQAKRKRGHLPVRSLFSQAPNVITALRPCWVMSPLMVSQLIPSDQAHFDLVVFDEASQVRPVDALSPMIRGRQLVVAGDERQLPPTTFFDATARSDDSEAEDLADDASEIGDYESVLDVLMTLFATEMLRWHYRSRDERLIGFSNSEIYGDSLTTFPGAIGGSVIEHVRIDELPAEDEARVSPDAEVRRVVDLILDHAKDRPSESLGVIALGIKHAEAIEAGLLAVLPDHPELEEFFAEDHEERFFVKNLERVQGDERDAIILAVGYGRTPDGDLPHRFGPLNNAGGERRLNVAVTRAKRRMTVVSSFQPEEIDPARSSAEGVKLLRSYLLYASEGGWGSASDPPPPERTALRVLIQQALEAAGHGVAPEYGSGSDRIDLAVLDRDAGTPLVAIEVDGPSYARRPSVRDRDRLRPEQLERLGWRHLLTWSQDWIRDPVEAARYLIDGVESSIECSIGADHDRSLPSPAPGGRDGPRDRGPCPAFASGGPSITDWSSADLIAMARWIDSDGLLRTSEELQREMMAELGFSRRGSRVARALDEAVAALRRNSG
jgi:hypothetical protein